MKKTLILLTGLIISACSSQSPKDNPILVEANQIHLEAEAIQDEIEPKIEKADSLKNVLIGQRIANSDSLAKKLSKIKNDFKDWEKDFFALPGFEHKHEKGQEHHQHNHTSIPELPADKMLEVQKEIKANIERIRQELNETLKQIKESL